MCSTSGNELTKYQYTGQYSHAADFGLMFYNARWYDPYLNHFTQPDSIVLDPYNSQDWDRYSYARNNPIKYTDPSGHSPCYGDNYDDGPQCAKNGSPSKWYYDNWKYQKTSAKNMFNNSISRTIFGFHYGVSSTWDFALGEYGYEQRDFVFDLKSGTIFEMNTTGSGVFIGTPNGVSLEGYIGTTNVHGIPLSASLEDVQDALSGENFDLAADIGGDIADLDLNVGKGMSLDLDPITGKPIVTTSGLMYTTENKVGLGVSIVPSPIILDGGAEGGHSNTIAQLYYQIPWWPFR